MSKMPDENRIIVEDIRSKNMFNKNRTKQNWYLSYVDGKTEIWDSNMAYMIDFIETESNQQYTMSYLEEATIFNIYEYDANKNFIQRQQQNNDKNSFTITTSATTKFIRVSCGKSCIDRIQFEQNSKATEYSKHFDFEQNNLKYEELDINNLLQNGWIQYAPGQIFKENGIVHICLCLKEGTEQTILALPPDFIPNTREYFFIPIVGVNDAGEPYGSVSPEGALECSPPLKGKLIFINVSYKVD